MTAADDRTAALEMRAMEQERAIEDLSDQIAEQWKVVERIQKKLDALSERFLALEELASPAHEATKPPHW